MAALGTGPLGGGTFTPDGRYVAFVSEADNLIPRDTNHISDVFVRDMTAETTVLAMCGGLMGLAAVAIALIGAGAWVVRRAQAPIAITE